MSEEFLPNFSDEPNAPVSGGTQDQAPPEREPLRHLLIGSPKAVKSAIHNLHVRGYAEATAWSPLQRTANPNEVMSMLLRYIRRN